jgi:hypothetical protein
MARLTDFHRQHYFDYAVHPGASARRAARRRLLRLRRTSGCLGTSCGSSPGPSSTTSTTPRVQVPRHFARLVTLLVVQLVVDYSAYAARPGASTRCAARHPALRRLLRIRRASGCLDTSCGSSPNSWSTISTTPRVQLPRHVARLITRIVAPLVVDNSANVTRRSASARRAARHPARHRLLHLRRVSSCFGTSRGLSRDSSSTTSPRVGSSSTT